ncbi:MAG: hypothetical protein V4805_20460 [Pseudomonadota bacterium]
MAAIIGGTGRVQGGTEAPDGGPCPILRLSLPYNFSTGALPTVGACGACVAGRPIKKMLALAIAITTAAKRGNGLIFKADQFKKACTIEAIRLYCNAGRRKMMVATDAAPDQVIFERIIVLLPDQSPLQLRASPPHE